MRVLVTGASGFTGRRLCERLSREGYAVRALVRRPKGAGPLQNGRVDVVEGDLLDPASLERAVQGVELVYHMASSFRHMKASAREHFEVNARGTRLLLEAASRAGVRRFVHCSTVGVHGDVKHPPADERTPSAPGDAYQASKAEGERRVLQYHREGRLPCVVVRPCGIYGPGDVRFLRLFKAIQGGRFFMIGSGKVYYHLVYIDDLVEGFLLCGTSDAAVGEVFILGDVEPVRVEQLVQLMAQALEVKPPRLRLPYAPVYWVSAMCELACKPLGLNPPLFRRRVKFFQNTRWFDTSKARRELGFQPATDLKAGLKRLVEWYRENGYL